jgi:hypothetical protein
MSLNMRIHHGSCQLEDCSGLVRDRLGVDPTGGRCDPGNAIIAGAFTQRRERSPTRWRPSDMADA